MVSLIQSFITQYGKATEIEKKTLLTRYVMFMKKKTKNKTLKSINIVIIVVNIETE